MEVGGARDDTALGVQAPHDNIGASLGHKSVVSAVHRVVIPPIPCSFPWKNHPDYKHLTEISDAWVLANFADMPRISGRRSNWVADHLVKSAFHSVATRYYPTGLSERMAPICKMMIWFFMVDNILDDPCEMGADPDGADNVVDSILTVFLDTYIHPCPDPNPLVQVLTNTAAEWWMEMCHDMPPKQNAHLRKAFCDYMEANRAQVPYRDSHQLPDLETYLKLRRASIGVWPCAVLIEYSQAFELDDEALSHPLILELQDNTVQHIILVNDITSLKKEYMEGDFFNSVSIFYFKNLYNPEREQTSPIPTLQGAVMETLQMIIDIDAKCVRLMEEINRCEDLMKKPSLTNYLEGLGFFRSGNLYFHLVSHRYGICATPDIHNIPPDMLALHIFKIKTNKDANHVVPTGVMM